MAEFVGAVYDPPAPQMPYVAIIVSDGELKFAMAVPNVGEGEARLSEVLAGLK